MTSVVFDASVAAKWCLPAAGEPLAEEALDLLKRYVSGELQIVVPDLFWPELGNILWKAVRQGRTSRGSAREAISVMRDRGLPTIPSPDLIEDALAIALRFERTVYDGVYVAAAIAQNTTLITADERLANALGGHLPVRWLGAV